MLKLYNARSTSELYDKCTFAEWQEISCHGNYHELIKTAIEIYVKYNLELQRTNLWQYATTRALRVLKDVRQHEEFAAIFSANDIDPHDFASSLHKVLSKSDSKINCFRMIGTPNSGKTLLANCIVDPFVCCYNNNHGSENEFYLSNFLNKSIILCEELYITIATAEDMKSVLGGQPIDVAKKFNEKQLLSRTPVIITSNYDRFGRGHISTVDELALSLRCLTFRFRRSVKPEVKLDSYQFYQYMLEMLYKQ